MMRNLFAKIPVLELRKILTIITVFVLLFMCFTRGEELKIDSRISSHVGMALKVAISTMYHNHPHDYTGLRSVFQDKPPVGSDPAGLNTMIQHNINLKIMGKRKTHFWVADDRGYEDYVIASFSLFGPKMISLYYMWFLILSLSVTLFLISFWRNLWSLGFLCLMMSGLYVAISILPLSTGVMKTFPTLIGQLRGYALYTPRYIAILSLVAIFHMIFFASHAFIGGQKKRSFLSAIVASYAPLMGQVFIFAFLYHTRSSLGWEALAVILFCVLSLILKHYHRKEKHLSSAEQLSIFRLSFTIILVLFAILSVKIYHKIEFNPKYFTTMGQRTFWHNAIIGLGMDPSIITIFNPTGPSNPDGIAASEIVGFAHRAHGCASIAKISSGEIWGSFYHNQGSVSIKDYEKCGKKLYFSLILNNKLKAIELYLLTKPLNALYTLVMASKNNYGTPPLRQEINKHRIGWHPFGKINLLFLGITLLLTLEALYQERKLLFFSTAVVLFCSFIPSVAFYSSIVNQGGMFAMFSVFIYLTLMIIVRSLSTKFLTYLRRASVTSN